MRGKFPKKLAIINRQSSPEEMLIPEVLAVLPAESLIQLKRGAEDVGVELLFSVIKQIRRCDAGLANALARLAEDFEHDEILEIVHCG